MEPDLLLGTECGKLAEFVDRPQESVAVLRIEPLLVSAVQYALTLDHPVYDCIYVAAASAHEAVLVTADERFVAAVLRDRELSKHIRLLGP